MTVGASRSRIEGLQWTRFRQSYIMPDPASIDLRRVYADGRAVEPARGRTYSTIVPGRKDLVPVGAGYLEHRRDRTAGYPVDHHDGWAARRARHRSRSRAENGCGDSLSHRHLDGRLLESRGGGAGGPGPGGG